MATTTPPARTPTPDAGVARTPEPDLVGEMFASSSVVVHVLRGVVGLVLLVGALVLAGDHPWALLGLVGTVVAWRGCPTCWTMGLIATVSRGRVGCPDGRCDS